MSRHKSADEVCQECVAAMGKDLGEIFSLLSNELTWLYWKWHEFVVLYAGSERRLEVLNSSAPFFFYVVQWTLWDETLLGISRLAGPATTGSKRNLSVRRLVPLTSDAELSEQLTALVESLTDACEFAIDLRNRRIAHHDLDAALGKSAKPLATATRERIDAALAVLATVLNAVQLHYQGSTTAYAFVGSPHGAENLLHVLRDGLKREEVRQRKLEEGVYDPDDWDDHEPPPDTGAKVPRCHGWSLHPVYPFRDVRAARYPTTKTAPPVSVRVPPAGPERSHVPAPLELPRSVQGSG